MEALQQFMGLLESMDLGEDNKDNKEKLLSALANVQGADTDLRNNLQAERDKTKPLKDKIASIQEQLGLQDGFESNDVKTYLESLQNSDKLEELQNQLTTKHEAEMNQLREAIQAEQNKYNDLNSNYDNLQFRISVENKGLLNDFIPNPIVRETLTNELKKKLKFEGGNAFIKDEAGNIAKDIQTGEPLAVSTLIDSYKNDARFKDFVSPTINTQGSDVQGGQGGGDAPKTKPDLKQYKSIGSFLDDNKVNFEG